MSETRFGKRYGLLLALVLVVLAGLPASAMTPPANLSCSTSSAATLFFMLAPDSAPPASPAAAAPLPIPARPSFFVGCDDICTCNSLCNQGCYSSPGVHSTCGASGAGCKGNC